MDAICEELDEECHFDPRSLYDSDQESFELPNDPIDTINNLVHQIQATLNESKNIKREIKEGILRDTSEISKIAYGMLLSKHYGHGQGPVPSSSGAPLPPAPLPALTEASLKKTIKECIKEEINELKAALTAIPPPVAPATTTTTSTPSYAKATSKPKEKPTPPITTGRHAVIIEKKGKAAGSATEIGAEWRKGISFRDATYAPARVQPISGGRLRVEFDTQAQRDETVNKLTKSSTLKPTPVSKLRPMVILKGISKDTPQDELPAIINHQNPAITQLTNNLTEDIQLRFIKDNKNNKNLYYNAILMVTPPIWKAITNLGRINIDHQRVNADTFCPVLQCYKCLQYGHLQGKCTATVPICSYCATTHHSYNECHKKNDPEFASCHNCKNHPKYSTKEHKHSATSNLCPLYQFTYERITCLTDYGD